MRDHVNSAKKRCEYVNQRCYGGGGGGASGAVTFISPDYAIRI